MMITISAEPGHWTDDHRSNEAQGEAQNAHAPQIPMETIRKQWEKAREHGDLTSKKGD